jgi:hypothetical protein
VSEPDTCSCDRRVNPSIVVVAPGHADGQVAMFVSKSRLPDGDVVDAFARWRTVDPTARRLVTVHWSRFLEDSSALRPGLAAGKYDASLLMPRGVRDEEFHTAVCELLSDWGSTVATPEVETDATSRSTGGPTASTLWASRRRCPGCGRLRGALGARMARP